MPSVTISSVLTIALIGGLAFFALSSRYSEDMRHLNIDIVGGEDQDVMDLLLQYVYKLDHMHLVFDYQFVTEREAKEDFMKGDCDAYIVVPEGFVDSVMTGANDRQIQYVTSEGSKGIASVMMDALDQVVSDLLINSQRASVAVIVVARDALEEPLSTVDMAAIDLSFLNLSFSRKNLISQSEMGISGGLGFGSFYFCSIFTFLILLCGMKTGSLFWSRSEDFLVISKTKKVSEFKQIAGELLSYMIMVFAYAGVSLLMLSIAKAFAGMDDQFEGIVPESLFGFFIRLLPNLAYIALWMFFLYECVSGIAASLAAQFVTAVLFCYISGYFYPSYLFPKFLRTLGRILPTGPMLSYSSMAFSKEYDPVVIVQMILYSIILVLACWLIRRRRLTR